jgi:hypothetical protein
MPASFPFPLPLSPDRSVPPSPGKGGNPLSSFQLIWGPPEEGDAVKSSCTVECVSVVGGVDGMMDKVVRYRERSVSVHVSLRTVSVVSGRDEFCTALDTPSSCD